MAAIDSVEWRCRPPGLLQVVAGRVDSVLMLDSHKQGAVDVLSWGSNHSDHSTWLPVWPARTGGESHSHAGALYIFVLVNLVTIWSTLRAADREIFSVAYL